jgi:hypothetical protein
LLLVVWISESWLRSTSRESTAAIRNIPIVGERLHVLGLEKSGQRDQIVWNVLRNPDSLKPTLQAVSDADYFENEALPFFLVPAMRAMGIPDPPFVNHPSGS